MNILRTASPHVRGSSSGTLASVDGRALGLAIEPGQDVPDAVAPDLVGESQMWDAGALQGTPFKLQPRGALLRREDAIGMGRHGGDGQGRSWLADHGGRTSGGGQRASGGNR